MMKEEDRKSSKKKTDLEAGGGVLPKKNGIQNKQNHYTDAYERKPSQLKRLNM